MDNNLKYYRLLSEAPEEALKEIKGGRLNGMSDINPMWRIKIMTETFGPCGLGWKYEISKQWQETFGQQVKAFVNIFLYVRIDGEWSDPIPGTGGSTLVEANGYFNDEAYKMALTDALSVAMKALGVAANVYSGKGITYDSKYSQQEYMDGQRTTTAKTKKPTQKTEPTPQPATFYYDEKTVREKIEKANSNEELQKIFNNTDPHLREKIKSAFTERKNQVKSFKLPQK